MAKIKGFELKNITKFRGHEGEELMQGDVYYKNKKVGYYSQDAWGGMDIFNIDYNLDKELAQKINKLSTEYVGGFLFKKLDDLYNKTYNVDFTLNQKGYEYLFMDLLQLNEHEKLYKKYSKKYNRNTIYIVYDTLFKLRICGLNNEDVLKNKTYFKYTSLKDFVID